MTGRLQTLLILGAGSSAGCQSPKMANLPLPVDARFFELVDAAFKAVTLPSSPWFEYSAVFESLDEPANGRGTSFSALWDWWSRRYGDDPPRRLSQRSLESVFVDLEVDVAEREREMDAVADLGAKIVVHAWEPCVHQARRGLTQLIALTIDSYYAESESSALQPAAELLARGRLSVISFNYDLVFDRLLLRSEGNPGSIYGESFAREANTSCSAYLLKPHGSLNWYPLDSTRDVDPFWPPDVVNLGTVKAGLQPESDYRLHASSTTCIRSASEAKRVLIVPPVTDKLKAAAGNVLGSHYIRRHRLFRGIWVEVGDVVAAAEHIVVAGYSLPPTDDEARAAFGRAKPKTLTVLDPDPGAFERWNRLLPDARASRREGVKELPGALSRLGVH